MKPPLNELHIFIMCLFITYNITSHDLHEHIFTSIYDNAVWGYNDKHQGFSGGGSLLQNCREYITFLEDFIQSHQIKTIVDAGCGDWEFSRYVNWQGAQYIGYDVVKDVIKRNQENFSFPHITFVHANFLTADIPEADLLLCKHVLQHLTNDDIISFLPQLKNFKYCLITNSVEKETLSSENLDIAIGGGRKIDLSQPPFNINGIKVLTYSPDGIIHQVFLIDNSQNN